MHARPMPRRISRWGGWLLVAALLLSGAGACRSFASPTSTPTQTAVATARQDMSTPTATTTWTVVPTATQLPRLVTATSTATREVVATPIAPSTQTPASTATETPTLTATPTTTPSPTSSPSPTSLPSPTSPPPATNTATPLPTATPTSSLSVAKGWRGEYFDNPNLSGNPALVREDAAIGFDWEDGAPASDLPADAFSVRWTSTSTFEEGQYNFHAAMDDGMRVYVDDQRIIDEWRDMPAREMVVTRHVTAGLHALRVEYYERGHSALARFWWEKDRSFAGWKGMYWPNLNFLGNPVLIRDDPSINFDWGMDGPGSGMPVDQFSVRWTRTVHLEEGSYRFRVQVDDGARLWVDGRQLIDAWHDHSFHELTADHVIGGVGLHTIVVEYYDNTFEARIHVSWERRGDPSYTHWKGEYFSNMDLAGDAMLVRNDRTLDFDWGIAAPADSLPADGFSVRWVRDQTFEPGQYRFRIHADDGVRFYVDDTLVIDEWHSARNETYEAEVALPSKPRLRIEFFEGAGDARIKFEWERIGG